jgi:Protein of unknown function (DUF3592)
MPLFVLGLCFAAVGGWLIRQDRRLARTGQRVRGIVVDLHWRWSGDASNGVNRICHPVLEFRTRDGQVIRTETRCGSGRVRVPPGRSGRGDLRPGQSGAAGIDLEDHRATWLPVVLAVVGLAITGFAVYRFAAG